MLTLIRFHCLCRAAHRVRWARNPQQHAQAPQVSVHIVKSAPLAVTTELPGRTDAYRVAEVRPQVSGIILHRNFTEGSDVKAGESLYQIDPATYQAAYDNAKGELVKHRRRRISPI